MFSAGKTSVRQAGQMARQPGGLNTPHPPLGGGRGVQIPPPGADLSRQAESRKRIAEEFRQACPVVTAVADKFREAFGPDVRLTFAAENGVEVGKRDTDVGFPLSAMVIDKAPAVKGAK
jgi:hypothetical protein